MPKKLLTVCFSVLLSLAIVFNLDASETSATPSNFELGLDESYSKVLSTVFSQDELQSLISKGFDLDAIELFVLSGESKEDILKRELLSTTTKYYITTRKIANHPIKAMHTYSNDYEYVPVTSVKEVSYEEYLKRLKNEDNNLITNESETTKTAYKSMTVSVSKKSTNVYTVTNSVDWSTPPLYKDEDIIGIGINANTSPIPGTEYGTQKWYTGVSHSHLGTINYSSNSSKWNRNGDYGLAVDLVDGDCLAISKCVVHKINMKYDIRPNVNNVTWIDAYGHYAHQEATFTVSPSFTISKGVLGISVSQQDKFTIHRPQPHVQIPKY